MRDFLKAQLEYNHTMNTAMLNYFVENKQHLSDNAIKWMSHVLLVHKMWGHIITGDAPVTDWWGILDINEMHEMEASNKALVQRILDSVETDDLIKVPNPRGGTAEFLMGDIVFHIFNHSNYHRGQINAELRHLGLQPLKTDYIFYKAMQQNQ